MKALGIDPAYAGPAGFALYDSASEILVQRADVLTFKRGEPPEERMAQLWEAAAQWLDEYQPDLLCVETTYQGRNAATNIGLALAVGGLQRVARERGIAFRGVAESQQRRTAQSYPPGLVERWMAHIPEKQRVHAIDAVAIAQVGVGMRG